MLTINFTIHVFNYHQLCQLEKNAIVTGLLTF